jgi:nicotinamide-nucleotide amidase
MEREPSTPRSGGHHLGVGSGGDHMAVAPVGDHVADHRAGRVDVASIVAKLAARGETLASAESLTGGLLAATIVDVPGASAVFRGGLIVYATDLKATLADVPRALLDERGPVDPDVAVALAAGARRRCGATWGVATTGVAGPTPQDGIAVGTVYVAVSRTPPAGSDDSADTVRGLHLDGDRPEIRTATVTAALALLSTALDQALDHTT